MIINHLKTGYLKERVSGAAWHYYRNVKILGSMAGQVVIADDTKILLVPHTNLALVSGGPDLTAADLAELPVFQSWGQFPGQAVAAAPATLSPALEEAIHTACSKAAENVGVEGVVGFFQGYKAPFDAEIEGEEEFVDPGEQAILERDAEQAIAPEVAMAPPAEVLAKLPKFAFNPFTIYILVGPTFSGKSTFAKEFAHLLLAFEQGVTVLSSDALREQFLSGAAGPLPFSIPEDRHAPVWDLGSKAAFNMLFAGMEEVTSFPINSPSVILDTTGFNEKFREDVRALAKRKGYLTCVVLFDYKKAAEYLPEACTPEKRTLILEHVSKLRKEVLPNLRRYDYDEFVTIKSKQVFGWDNAPWANEDDGLDDWLHAVVSVEGAGTGYQRFLQLEDNHVVISSEEGPLVVIGDSHECVNELRQLFEEIDKRFPQGATVVLVGDYLDKGGDTAEMLNLLAAPARINNLYIVRGNHENYVYQRIVGNVKDPNLEMEKANFSSLEVLLADTPEAKALQEKFLDLWTASQDFLVVWEGDSKPVYITHAPCEEKYLGKTTGDALRAQRNFRVEEPKDNFYDELKWLYDEAHPFKPLHVFGHVASLTAEGAKPSLKTVKFKNKVFIDTAAVYGGHLSAAVIKGGQLTEVLSVKSSVSISREGKKPIPVQLACPPREQRPFNRADYSLTPGQERQVSHILKSEVRYISGTMAPAPARVKTVSRSEEKGAGVQGLDSVLLPESEFILESLEEGLLWYKDRGVEKVILEPKHMGSRGNLYLYSGSPELTTLVSRGGWVVRGLEGLSEEEYKLFLQILYQKYQTMGVLDEYGTCILDGEIMPWEALGRGLIDREFGVYSSLVNAEVRAVTGSLGGESGGLTGLDLTKFPGEGYLDNMPRWTQEFDEAVSAFGSAGQPHFRAFSVLWSATMGDHLDDLPEDELYYAVADKGPSHLEPRVLSLADATFADSLAQAATMFAELERAKQEGLVIKPIDRKAFAQSTGKKDLPPYMKVRNEWYLKLVYGVDFKSTKKYRGLTVDKRIGGKVRLSVQEALLGKELLTAPPEKREEIVVKMTGLLQAERELDPRL